MKSKSLRYPLDVMINDKANSGMDVQNHLYNGKELDRMHGLNLYDYSARQYDAAIGQFTSMDPLCEKYYHISPYAYCAGNPVKYVDPDGRDYELVIDEENMTITFRATYFVQSGMEEFEKAKEYWMGLNGLYEFGDYTINFDISSVDNKDEAMNTFSVGEIYDTDGSNEVSKTTAGECLHGNEITLNNRISVESTGAHEMGHSLGFAHYLEEDSNNLMYYNGADRKTPSINKDQIQYVLQMSIKGKTDFDIVNGVKVYEGRMLRMIGNNSSNSKLLEKQKARNKR